MKNINELSIGGKKIGDGNLCFITFEAGPTHDGLSSAKQLVKCASENKADAIKFQILDPERLMADKDQIFKYEYLYDKNLNIVKSKEESLYKILKRRSLQKDEWIELKNYSDSLNLPFFATIAYEDEIELVCEMGCETIKIASADVNFYNLIKEAAKSGLIIQLDTGNSTIGEIEKAVNVTLQSGNNKIIIHHCPSGYPARLDSINLNIIKTLKKMFEFPIAFSDHSPGFDMDIVAISFGANMLEKTITMNRETPSVEHVMSLEPIEAKSFVDKIREIEVAFGSYKKVLTNEEEKKRNLIRRSPYLQNDAKKNTKVSELPIVFSRPGLGLTPNQYANIKNITILKEDLKKGQVLKFNNLSFV